MIKYYSFRLTIEEDELHKSISRIYDGEMDSTETFNSTCDKVVLKDGTVTYLPWKNIPIVLVDSTRLDIGCACVIYAKLEGDYTVEWESWVIETARSLLVEMAIQDSEVTEDVQLARELVKLM